MVGAGASLAVLEGVAFGLRDVFELMKNAGLTSIGQLRVSGGGAKSPLLQQILADVFNSELVTVNTTEGAAYGAALLAGVGVGHRPTVESAFNATGRVTDRVNPREEAALNYERVHGIYRGLFPALRQSFLCMGG